MLFFQPYLLEIQFTNDNQHPTFSLSLFTVRKKRLTYQVMYSDGNTQISPIEHGYIPAKINKIERLAQVTSDNPTRVRLKKQFFFLKKGLVRGISPFISDK